MLEQPVILSVKVKFTLPAATPETNPPLVTVAIELLPDTQVPPEFGDKFVEEPTQIAVAPVTETVGNDLTVIEP